MATPAEQTASKRNGGGSAPPDTAELSVIIVSYDVVDHVRRCLASLQAERGSIELEILLVDNASSDATVDVVRREFPWVRVIALGENVGFSRANNVAIARATGHHILLLNPDTVVAPGTLAACVAELERRPEIGMLGCKLVRPDGRLDHACKRGFPTPLSSLYHFAGLTRVMPRSPRFAAYTAGHVDPEEAALVDAVNGAFMLVRRPALEAVGPLDEGYWLYMEDLDWCFRFWEAGYPVRYWPGATVMHVKGGSGRSARANIAFHRGMWRFYRRHYAPRGRALTTLAVWAGVHIKLLLSLALSWVRRAGDDVLAGVRSDRP